LINDPNIGELNFCIFLKISISQGHSHIIQLLTSLGYFVEIIENLDEKVFWAFM
jgi:hypothetical protein